MVKESNKRGIVYQTMFDYQKTLENLWKLIPNLMLWKRMLLLFDGHKLRAWCYTCTTSYQKHESPTHQVQAFLLCEKGPVQYQFCYCFVVVFCYDLTTQDRDRVTVSRFRPLLLWPLEEKMIWNHGIFECWGGNTQFAPLSILGLSWDRRWECMAAFSWVKMSQGCQGQADGESVMGGLNFLYPFPTLRNIWWLATICNLYLYDLHDATIDSSKTFPKKKHPVFPQFSRGFLRDSFPFASVISPFFSRLQGSDRHRSVRQRLRGAKGPGTESHPRAGGTARPQETGPARFFWTSTGPTAVDFFGDFFEKIVKIRHDPNFRSEMVDWLAGKISPLWCGKVF